MPLMIGRSFKGDLSEISLPDILEFLRAGRKTGVISFKRDHARKSLYIKEGNVIFATSNISDERLGDLLLTRGKITREQFDQSARLLDGKKRQGKILIELGAITPKDLWDGVQAQIRQIVYSLFNWEYGIFFFSAGELPSQENITADVGLLDLVVEGIRRISDNKVLTNKFPSKEIILARMDYGLKDRMRLEDFEKHVLDLINGQRTVGEICRESEIGEMGSLRVLYLLLSLGYIKVKARKNLIEGDGIDLSQEEARSIVTGYNKMFSYLYRYMMREVGPITEHVLGKYLLEIGESNPAVLKDVILMKDGTLDEEALHENLIALRGKDRKEVLVASLNEFLYSTILAVKRTLGPDHESRVVETLKEIRPEM